MSQGPPSVESYIKEMRRSREEVLAKIGNQDISSRCKESISNNVTVKELFNSEERDRIVMAFADKLKSSREETLAKLQARQRTERAKVISELKDDIRDIVDSLVEKMQSQMEASQRLSREELEKKHHQDLQVLAKQQQQSIKSFHETCLVNLRASLAEQRADALKRFTAEMNTYRDNQLDHLTTTSIVDDTPLRGHTISSSLLDESVHRSSPLPSSTSANAHSMGPPTSPPPSSSALPF